MTMNKFWILLVIFILTETILAFFFAIIAQVFYKRAGIDFKSIVKGIIERTFLAIALTNDLTAILYVYLYKNFDHIPIFVKLTS